MIRNIQKGVDLAAKNGAKVVSLGGYASIITNNGKAILEPENVKVVTGNTLTAVVGYHKFKNKIKTLFHRKNDLTIGVVGATGNIGKILTRKLVDDDAISMKSLWLVGRSNTKLNLIKDELPENSLKRNIKLNCSTDLKDLKRCDAIIVAVNTNDPIIYPNHIKENLPVLIADLSIPGGVAEELQGNDQVHILPFAASIKLMEDEDYLITSCSPRGTALCCTAEAFLNAFENTNVNLRGDITYQGFNIIDALARKYGFIQHIDNLRTYKSTISHELSV